MQRAFGNPLYLFTDMLTSEERVVIYEAFQPPGGKRVSIDKMSR